LVQAAYDAELSGDSSRRGQLLADALKLDPENRLARWRTGQVQLEGQWRSLAAVSELVSSDSRWQQYDAKRQFLGGAPGEHAELAQWCARQGMENEERYHWMQALMANPSDELALNRLGLREYRGGLYTDDQIAQFEQRLEQRREKFEELKPKFRALCRRAARGETQERQAALAEIGEVAELAAIAPLQDAVKRETRKATAEAAVELNLAVVRAIANVPDYEATLELLDYSLLAPQAEVRRLAATSLRLRPVTDWVPLLMGSLKAPIEGQIDYMVSPDGTVSYGENLFQAGPESDMALVRAKDYVPVMQVDRPARPGQYAARVSQNRAIAARQAAQARARVALANAQVAADNGRVREVLRNSLNMDLGDDPKVYWQQWIDYNELSYDDHPTYRVDDLDVVYTPSTHSCFMAGTPVWTLHGARPIEELSAGDLVLSQHPDTGELAYRPVLEKTLGPPTKTLELKYPGETIVATPGHRLWVDGQGWQMMKELKPGVSLYGIDGALQVESLAASDELECHNLVVEGFHTFFVGKSRILVHDKSCPQPTVAVIPGGAGAAKALVADSGVLK
jgi:hypothetical protein